MEALRLREEQGWGPQAVRHISSEELINGTAASAGVFRLTGRSVQVTCFQPWAPPPHTHESSSLMVVSLRSSANHKAAVLACKR